MAGTKDGGKKAAETNRSKYGDNYYQHIGLIGSEAYRQRQRDGVAKPRGFAVMDKDRLRQISKNGGRKRQGK